MKKLIILFFTLGSLLSYAQDANDFSLTDKNDSLSYALGIAQSDQFMTQLKMMGGEELIDTRWLIIGVKDGVKGESLISEDKLRNIIITFLGELKEKIEMSLPDATQGNVLKNAKDSLSYATGYQSVLGIDQGLKKIGIAKFVDKPLLVKGIEDYQNKTTVIQVEKANGIINKYIAELTAEMAKVAEAEGKAFLEQNKLREGVHVTASGLQYEILEEGTGIQPTANSKVKVHYHGTLIDGTVFDSSVERGEPIVFGLNQVISGWTEGLQLMKVGAKYKFYIPHELAYGPRAMGKIGAYSTLIFEVELLGIE